MTELTLDKKQQMKAIKYLNDWSKWVITIETAAIAGIFAVMKESVSSKIQGLSPLLLRCTIASDLLLLSGAVFFVISIHYAGQLLFSLPDIIEQLPTAKEDSINKMQSKYMNSNILTYERRQFKTFVTGLVLVATASAAVIIPHLFP